jgi:hypothetical protein
VPASESPAAPVTPDDIDNVVARAITLLAPAADRGWHVPAGSLSWTCWETIEHMADDLFAYAMQLAPKDPPMAGHTPVAWRRHRDGGPASTIFADPAGGNHGLLQVLDGCGGLLSAVVRITPPQVRAHHVFGVSDAGGFAAMGVTEVLVHTHDVAAGLHLDWRPPAGLSDRVLRRLFPDAPADTDRWSTLLWATGRAELPGRPAPASWQWDGTPR